ncbi:MAG: hypothetical protein R3B06_09465 [Kofleriaceae bacterium]
MRRGALMLVVAAGVGAASADPTGDRLTAATAAAQADDWATVARLAGAVADDPATGKSDRGEAHRLLGLAALAAQAPADAEAHFLAYLKLELDGRLDPALYPPETIAFFEDVRARHSAELKALRPRPKRSLLLNALPPAGQFQNRERTKGWTLGIAGGTALAANVGTYAMLRSWCDADGTCAHASTARVLRTVNLVTGAAAIGLYVYGVIDGVRHFRRAPAARLTPIGGPGMAGVGVVTTF